MVEVGTGKKKVCEKISIQIIKIFGYKVPCQPLMFLLNYVKGPVRLQQRIDIIYDNCRYDYIYTNVEAAIHSICN